MKATIQHPQEPVVTLVMTESEARELLDLAHNTDPAEWTIVAKIHKCFKGVL